VSLTSSGRQGPRLTKKHLKRKNPAKDFCSEDLNVRPLCSKNPAKDFCSENLDGVVVVVVVVQW
jgi:hypothetical protein